MGRSVCRFIHSFSYALLLSGTLLVTCGLKVHRASSPSNDARQIANLTALAALDPIDAHTHIFRSDPQVIAMLERWHLHVLDIMVADDKDPAWGPLAEQRADVLTFIEAAHGHASFCTTFDPLAFSQPNFRKMTIHDLDRDFAQGAIAVKIWKNIGMELKDSSGHFVLADDARLAPIYHDIAAHNKTLLAHQADPDDAWESVDSQSLAASYYTKHPEWNMVKIPNSPSKATIIAARDHLVAEIPHCESSVPTSAAWNRTSTWSPSA